MGRRLKAVRDYYPFFCISVVGLDEQGVVFALRRCFTGLFSLHLAEVYAVREGVRAALRFNAKPWKIETDATNVVQAFGQGSPPTIEHRLVDEIGTAVCRFREQRIQHTNKVARQLTTNGLMLGTKMDFVEPIPFTIMSDVQIDLLSR